MKIVLVCVECGVVTHAAWPETAHELRNFMRMLWREARFVLSIASAAGPLSAAPAGAQAELSSKDVVMAPVCETCAKRLHGQECLDEVERSFGETPPTKRSGN